MAGRPAYSQGGRVSLDAFIGAACDRALRDPARAPAILAGAAMRLRAAALNPKNAPRAAVIMGAARELLDTAAHRRPPPSNYASRDDFAEMLDDQFSASEAVPNGSDIEEQAHVRALREARSGEEALASGSILITPGTVEGASLGDSATVVNSPTAAQIAAGIKQEQTVIMWQGRKRESMAFTIDIDVIQAPAVPGSQGLLNPVLRPYAKVKIGADASRGPDVQVDVGQGMRLQGAGNYVSVALGQDPPPAGFKQAPITLSARLGFFSAATIAPTIRSLYLDSIMAAGDAILNGSPYIPRPLRAVGILPPQSSDINDVVQIDFLDYGLNIKYSLQFPNGTVVNTIPLSGEIYFLHVKSTSQSVNTVSIVLPFLMSL